MKLTGLIFAVLVIATAARAGAPPQKPDRSDRTDPDRLLALAKDAMQKEDWETASHDLGAAIRYGRGTDPAVWVMLADSFRHLTSQDFSGNNRQFLASLGKALQIDPRYLPAHAMLIEHQLDLIRLLHIRKPEVYEALSSEAEKVLALDPTDHRANYAWAFAQIDQQINGLKVDPAKLNAAENKCAEMIAAYPADADPALLLAHWRVFRMWEQARQGNIDTARQQFDALDGEILKWTAAQKDNPAMLLAVAQLEEILADSYPTRDPTADATVLRRKRAEFHRRAFDHLETAYKLLRPTDPQYVETVSFYAHKLERPMGLIDLTMPRADLEKTIQDASRKAEALYREVLQNDPGEGMVRLKLAEFLGRENRREEAIEILQQQPAQPSKSWIGVRGFFAKDFQRMAAIDIANFRLDLIDTKTDKAQRDALMRQVQTDYDKLAKDGESDWQVQQIKGRLQFLSGHLAEANASFENAIKNFQGDSDALSSLKYFRAKIFLAGQKWAEARDLLRDVVATNPGNFLARAQLAEVLINLGNINGTPPNFDDGAVAQVDELSRLFPADNPIVLKLRLRTLDRQKDKEQFQKFWAMIPEKTVEERYDKSRFAASMNDVDESIRLLESIRVERPTVAAVIQPLLRMYLSKNDAAKALALLDDAIAKSSPNDSLQHARQVIADPSTTIAARIDAIQKISDAPVK